MFDFLNFNSQEFRGGIPSSATFLGKAEWEVQMQTSCCWTPFLWGNEMAEWSEALFSWVHFSIHNTIPDTDHQMKYCDEKKNRYVNKINSDCSETGCSRNCVFFTIHSNSPPPPSSPTSLLEAFKALIAIRVYSHSYWLVIFCTANSSRVLARERWQSFENSWK